MIEDYNETEGIAGYISFAVRDTNCAGASDFPEQLGLVAGSIWEAEFATEPYLSLPYYVDVTVCFAEYSTGGTDDAYFVEQTEITNYFVKEIESATHYDWCDVGCNFGQDCYTCTDEIYFSSSQGCCGSSCSSELADDVCCYSRGSANCTSVSVVYKYS